MQADELRSRVAEHQFWYHTIDIAPGVTTPGWFDLRPVLDVMPWPDVAGRRCLDIGTFDGFLAFEMERRGASDVMAVDLVDHTEWDWPLDVREDAVARDPGMDGPAKGTGFRLAADLLDSKVEYREISIYDLDPDEIGTFDVVVCGSLMLHLRDPLRALEAVRAVTAGMFLSAEQVEVWSSVALRRRPVFRLDGRGRFSQWWIPNVAGHRRLIEAAGFDIDRTTRPYVIPYNQHPPSGSSRRALARSLGRRLLTGGNDDGVVHHALLAHPRTSLGRPV